MRPRASQRRRTCLSTTPLVACQAHPTTAGVDMFHFSSDPFPGQELTPAMLASVDIEERLVPGPPGGPDVRVLLYKPGQRTAHSR